MNVDFGCPGRLSPGIGRERKRKREGPESSFCLDTASWHLGSLVRDESLSFALEGICFSHMSQNKYKE